MQWLFALCYLGCYAPYAYLIHRAASPPQRLTSLATLPIATLSCALTFGVFLLVTGWWRRLKWGPAVYSGAATSIILLSSTLAYSLPAVSVLLMVTLMKGGVLLLAPLLDVASRRVVPWGSRVALTLAGSALIVSCTWGGVGTSAAAPGLPAAALAVITAYLSGYAVKLSLLGPRKASTADDRLAFILTDSAATVTFAMMAVVAATGLAHIGLPFQSLASGWGQWARGDLWIAGALSQGTGIFGGLILVGAQGHSHCVTFNRAAGVLAGVVATFLAGKLPGVSEWIGAGLILCAVVALTWRKSPVLGAQCLTQKGSVR